MRVTRLVTLLALAATPAFAGPDCQDQFNECQDDCSMQHGSSVKDEAKKAFQKCLSKCVKKSNLCREQVMEVRNNDLDEKALDHSPAAQELDENGYAKKGTGLRGKAVKGKDDVREEDPPGFFDDPGDGDAPKKRKKKKKAKPEVREEEIVRSSRTSYGEEPSAKSKGEDEPARKEKPASKEDQGTKKGKAPVAETRPEPKPEPEAEPPPRAESKPAPKPEKKASSDDDEDERPAKRSKEKEAPKKSEDDDDLRNY